MNGTSVCYSGQVNHKSGFLPLIRDENQGTTEVQSSRYPSSGSVATKTSTTRRFLPPLSRRSYSLFNIIDSGKSSLSHEDYHRQYRSRSLSHERPLLLNKQRRVRRLCSIQQENRRLLKMRNLVRSSNSPPNSDILPVPISNDVSSWESSIRLEEHIKLRHLQKLLQIFKSHQPSDPEKNISNDKKEESTQIKQLAGMMTLQEFTKIISDMLGTTKWNDQMEMLFHKVDTGCDNFVDWNEFCTYMLLQMREMEHKQNLKLIPFSSSIIVKQIFHNKQETTTKSAVVENPTRIVTVSKVGAICVWDFDLRLLKTYNLAADVAESQQQTTRRRFHTWVTDMVYMRNTQNLALTTSNREIYFYDISTPIYAIEFCLYALPNVPVCANYWYNKSARNSHSMLFFGDDTGAVHVLHFYAPQSRLFQKPFSPKQGPQRVYFNELKDHRQYVSYEKLGNIHDEVVRRILYVRESNVIISSSMSSSTSVVLMDFEQKKKPYIFKVNKGVECFDYSKSLNVLVTGSLDHLVRVWNPYVVAKPITILHGHQTGICDVTLNEAYAQIVTYSKDAVIKVWDIKEHTCLQTISPKFPSLQPGRIPEHGEFPLSLYGSPHDVMLATCNDSVAMLKMGKLAPKEQLPTTHNTPLCGALYNELFHQVVTASDDSTVSVWDVETGIRSLTFSNAHGQEEITCLSFDQTSRRLFTGARDGSIKIWNFQNGNCLHELEAVCEAEVTGVLAFQDRTILAVGWSRLVSTYDDSDPDIVNISVKTNWKGGQLHQDDILTVAHGYPNLLATGSYDGCIIIWNEETQQVYLKLREGKRSNMKNGNARPVDVLFFLQERSRQGKNRATMISSEGGVLYWWCLFGRRSLLGHFQAAETKDSSVLAITSSSDDVYLITGDTSGYVTVWNIEKYCTSDQGEIVITEKPPLIYHWKAHDRAIVSLNFVDIEFQAMVVTASTDKTARLWTLEGRFVGTFGQRKKWNLKQPSSYQYPLDPWGVKVELPEPGHAYMKKHAQEKIKLEEKAPTPLLQENNEIKIQVSEETKNASLQQSQTETHDVSVSAEVKKEDDLMKDDRSSQEHEDVADTQKATCQGDSQKLNETMTEIEDKEIEEEFEKFENQKEENTGEKKSILGVQTEGVFAQRSVTRLERRHRVGFIDEKCTSRFGNLCSPFQALSIRNTESVSFDPSMPMTSRMRDKGMHCSNEEDLFKMPLYNLVDFNDAEPSKPHKRRHNLTARRTTLLPSTGTSTPSNASTK